MQKFPNFSFVFVERDTSLYIPFIKNSYAMVHHTYIEEYGRRDRHPDDCGGYSLFMQKLYWAEVAWFSEQELEEVKTPEIISDLRKDFIKNSGSKIVSKYMKHKLDKIVKWENKQESATPRLSPSR